MAIITGSYIQELARSRLDKIGQRSNLVEKAAVVPTEVPRAYRAYLLRLERSFLIATGAAGAAVIVAILAFSELTSFVRTGSAVLHPWLAILLGVSSLLLAVVSVTAGFTAKGYLRAVISEICGSRF